MTTLTQDFQALENYTLNLFATIKADVEIAEADIIKVFQFIQPYGTQIATGITGALAIAASAGIGVPPAIILAAQGLSAAASVVNQAVSAQQVSAASGGTQGNQAVTLLATAYQGLKAAQVSLSQGQAALAAGPAKS